MSEASDRGANGQAAHPSLLEALRSSAIVAALTFGLCFPIIALRTEQDINNQLVLQPRWGLVLRLVLLSFVLSLAARLLLPRLRAGMAASSAARPDTPAGLLQALPWAGLALIALFPAIMMLTVGPSGAIKWVDNYGVQILIYVMLGWGLNIVVGLAGLLDLGYVAFYAVGAYAYAIIATKVIPETLPFLGPYAFWICLPIAGILAALWGVILGFPVLRLRGDYLAIVTLAFGEIIRLVLINWVDFSNGYAGIQTPRITFFGIPFTSITGDPTFNEVFGLTGTPTVYRSIFLYYVILVLALVTAVVTTRLRRLPVGRAWEALREDEIACRSLGINTTSTKLTAFAIGAGFGGLAGSFFGARQGFVDPKSFEFLESATILAIVVLGGMGSLVGVAVAAVAMIGGTEILRELDFLKHVFGDEFDPAQYRMLIFGLAMVAMMIWKPRGLISTREPSIVLKERKTVSGDLVKEGHG
ncbi:MAG: high-affinity branched-chain amino acid ABC transporter permease LivM [Hyphomicrobiaceae bacterium]|nr:high-affinity branched-chain amino acid ABC transporter permease LivM [Hyphomicrobiaceae bacterium]